MALNPEKTAFGTKTVTPDEKTGLVRGVFDSVASRYDVMNDLMSGGLHRLWKDRFVTQIRPRPGLRYLDVAGGTGDIAFRIRKKLNPSPDLAYARSPSPKGRGKGPVEAQSVETGRVRDSAITICDLTPAMLEEGRSRAINKGWLNDFEWVTGNAESLPFPDRSFDIYTIAFGLRNVTHIDTALKEAARVLKKGGRFFCLEFSHVDDPILAKIYDAYSFGLIPRMGKLIANDAESYQYLVESIRKFPKPNELCQRMEGAGMQAVRSQSLTGGIVAIHQGLAI